MNRVVYFLGEMSSDDISWFISVGHKNELPEGASLITQGRHIKALYILITGELSVVVEKEGGAEIEIAHLSAGDIVGELSFLDHRPPAATVRAATDNVTILAIPRYMLEEKLQSDLAFASRFFRGVGILLSSRLRKTVSNLGYPESPEVTEEEEKRIQRDLVPDEFRRSVAEGWFDFMLQKIAHQDEIDHTALERTNGGS
jgi:CRP-like cAMP-binding protein